MPTRTEMRDFLFAIALAIVLVAAVVAVRAWSRADHGSAYLNAGSTCQTWNQATAAQHQHFAPDYGQDVLDLDLKCHEHPHANLIG